MVVDGLGFEEVNQSGLSTNLVQGVSGAFTLVDASTNVTAAAETVAGVLDAGSFATAGSTGFTGTVSGVEFVRGLAVAGP